MYNVDDNIYLIVSEAGNGGINIGTGFFAYGYIATCFHVINNNPVRIRVFNRNRQEIVLDMLGNRRYPKRDIALLRPISPIGGNSTALNLSISIPNGTQVYTKGYSSVNPSHFSSPLPFPITQLSGIVDTPGVFIGSCLGINVRNQVQIYVKNCAWPHGASGSPVFKNDGTPEIIGMVYYSFPPDASVPKNEAIAVHSYELWSVLYDLGAIP